MDLDLADVLRGLQAHVLPGSPCVGALVDAVPARDVAANARLAHSGVDHVRVGRRDLQRPDRRGLEEAVRHIAPALPAVARLPDPATGRAEVERLLVDWI